MTLGLFDHLVAILFGLVLPFGNAIGAWRQDFSEPAEPMTTADKVKIYWANAGFLWVSAGLVVGLWLWNGRALATLGLRAPTSLSPAIVVGAVVLIALTSTNAWYKLRTPERLAKARHEWRTRTPFLPASLEQLGHSVALILAAAVCEEIVFRGFLIRYLETLLGGSQEAVVLAVVVPAAAFGVAHAFEGANAAFRIFALAIVLGWLFVATGSLWLPMVLHFAIDLGMSFLGIRLLRDPKPDPGPES